MPFPFRLAAIDLDDTLLGRDHLISARNNAAVRTLAARGVVCVIASGRMHEATTKYADALGLNDPIISYNGAMVKCRGEVWHHLRVPAEPSAEIVRYAEANGHHLNFYLNDRLFVAHRGEWAEFYVRQTGSPMEEAGSLLQFIGQQPTKMILIDTPEVTDRLLARFTEQFGDALYITKTNPQYLEFMNPAANKGAALAIVTERRGIPREQTIAFGDGLNDLTMIGWAGRGVAMAGSKPEVLELADDIAPPFEEDGLGMYVERLLAEA